MLFRNENPNLGSGTTVRDVSYSADLKPQISEILMFSSAAAPAVVGVWHTVAVPYPCTVLAVKENHAVAGAAGVTVKVRKITADAVAPSAVAGGTCIELLSAGLTIDSTANTVQVGALSAVAGAITLAKGDRIGLLFSSATQTGLVGFNVQIEIARN